MVSPLLFLRCGGDVVLGVQPAPRLSERILGLMGQPPDPRGVALWLRPCRSIHTCFMRFAIDVVFLDANLTVLRVACAVPPWRLVWAPRHTASALELDAGRATTVGLAPGRRLFLSAASAQPAPQRKTS